MAPVLYLALPALPSPSRPCNPTAITASPGPAPTGGQTARPTARARRPVQPLAAGRTAAFPTARRAARPLRRGSGRGFRYSGGSRPEAARRSQVGGVAGGSGVVGGQQTGVAEPRAQGGKIGRARQYVVARIVGIGTQTMGLGQLPIGRGHQLHEPHRPRPRGDRHAVQVGSPAAFGAHHRHDPGLRNVEPPGRFGDPRTPWLDARGRRRARRDDRHDGDQGSHSGVARPMIAPLLTGPK